MADKGYISIEEIEKQFSEILNEECEIDDDFKAGCQSGICAAMVVPAADVAPVRHGYWIECKYGLTFECSECKYPTEYNLTNFCPNCGAKLCRGE